MRVSAIWKSTFREIRQSFGRFAAILAIIALGVGLFAGLKVTKSAMVHTTEQYLREKAFYDFRLLSTLGFEEQEVELLKQQEGVAAAQGAHSCDVIYQEEDGSEGVAKVHSLTEGLNVLQVLEGRLPERADECVADAGLFGASALGRTITFSEANEEEELEHFTGRSYQIVGIVQSPLYIQFERGNTSLGTGRIDGFLYLLPESFADAYYTEIYVKFQQDFPMYSDAYEDFIEEREGVWENLVQEAALNRYDRLLKESEEKLSDARQELSDKKAEGEQELLDARQELSDALEELQEGEDKLLDARRELVDARQQLSDAKKELADGRELLSEKEKELADGEKKLADGRRTWDGKAGELEAARQELQQAQEEWQTQQKQLEESKEQLDLWDKSLEEQREALQEAQLQLDSELARLLEWEAAYEGLPMPEEVAAQIRQGKKVIEESRVQLEKGRKELLKSEEEYQVSLAAYEEGEKKLKEAAETIHEGWEQVKAGDAALKNGRTELDTAQKELEKGRQELEDAKASIEENEEKLAEETKKLEEAEETVEEREEELAEGKQEYEEGQEEYREARQEFEERIAEAEEELAEAEEELADLEEPDSYVLGRDTNVGYVCFESDSAIVDGIANVFPVFFFLVAALVCITTMNRMVEEQRTQIGVLKALGYGEGRIMFKYLFYAGLAALGGCLLGFFGGTWLFPKAIWTAYGMMYRVDTLKYVYDWRLAIVSFMVSLLCSVGTTFLSCRVELGSAAAQLMRPKSPKAGKRVFLEYVPFIWRRLGFLRKVSVRNIMRYKKRLVMMVLGIGGCTALLITGFGIKDSIAGVADQQFGEIQVYDISVTYSEGIREETISELEKACGERLAGRLAVLETSGDLIYKTQQKSVDMVVFDEAANITDFLKLHTVEGEPIANPGPGEAVISHKIAEQMGISVGDEILLRDSDRQEIAIRISAIQQNFIYNYIHINSETYTSFGGQEPEKKTLYLNAAKGEDVHQLSALLMKLEDVSGVSVNQDIRVRFNSMMKSLNLIVAVVILCAAGLAFIVLYNLTNINIMERIREIATIKVLGFYRKETAMYVFRENLVLTALGALAGLLLGRGLHLFVMNQIRVDMITFDVHILPISFMYSILLTFLFTLGINLLMGVKLEKISMTESLKSVD
ncbi:MAG: ABC transporter permease [Roseburia sp.]|nr:ABC transporter permease [Roseburia sp.]